MADTTRKFTVRNIAEGTRGLNAVTGYVELDKGQSRPDVELTQAEYANAERTGYFEFTASGGASSDEQSGDDPNALPTTHAKLDELAKAEEITFGADVKTVADKQAAITAARAAKAGGPGGNGPSSGATGGGSTDELDKMDDDTLRNTAAAISGKPVADLQGMDRDGLLKLARGQ